MKIRKGFVSNSSSSSFILALDKKPESIEELQKLLFGDKETFPQPYGENSYPTKQVAETIFNDLKDQKPATKEKIAEELGCGWVDGAPKYDDYKTDSDESIGGIDWEKYQKDCDEFHKKSADELMSEKKDKEFYIVEYADDDGEYFGSIEHGGTFDNIDSVRISKH